MLRKRKLLTILKSAARGPSKKEVNKVYAKISDLSKGDFIAFAFMDYSGATKIGYGTLTACVKIESSISGVKGQYPCARDRKGRFWKLRERTAKDGRTFIFGSHDPEAVEVRNFEAGTYYLPVIFNDLIISFARKSEIYIDGICLFKVNISPPANLDKENISFISSSGQTINVSEQIKKFENMQSNPDTDTESQEYKSLKMMYDMFGEVLDKKYPEKCIEVNILLGEGDYKTAEGARQAIADGDKIVQVNNKGVSGELSAPSVVRL